MDQGTIVGKIIKLTKQLYPTGRAFKIPEGGWYYRLHVGLAQSEARAYAAVTGVLDGILPDNPRFTADDASAWERRLGLIDGTGVSLEDRKAAIRRKMNHPGPIAARGNWMYVEAQLQLAGFQVWVHENRFSDGAGGWVTVGPWNALVDVDYGQLGEYELGEFELGSDESYYSEFFNCAELGEMELGEMELGSCNYNQKVVNSIDAEVDAGFYVPTNNLKATFYIGGQVFGTFADVPASREIEFRQLILKLKQTQNVAFLLVNYTT
jgi:hypothetical protein